jgi:membrane fusion protein (multidrug efflux system)
MDNPGHPERSDVADDTIYLENSGSKAPVTPPESATKRPWLRWIIMASLPLLLLIGGGLYWYWTRNLVSTDNAYVQQDKVAVSSEINGPIAEVFVRDGQIVKAGDLLFRIDPAPFALSLRQAQASIADAQVAVQTMASEYAGSSVDISLAREDIAFAQAKFARQQALMDKGFTTRADYDAARHAVTQAQEALKTAQADAAMARSKLARPAASMGKNPAIAAAEVQRDLANLNLRRTEIRAPIGGRVAQVERLLPGQMMVSGLPAVTIVASDKSWIEANFKETDLDRMRVGQRASLTFPAYPGLELTGFVASIGAGTGSEFSVLPAQNASGNWVKVTQRVPVRIEIRDKPGRALIAGMSADVTVDLSSKTN